MLRIMFVLIAAFVVVSCDSGVPRRPVVDENAATDSEQSTDEDAVVTDDAVDDDSDAADDSVTDESDSNDEESDTEDNDAEPDCVNDATSCDSNQVYKCVDNEWQLWDECSKKGLICAISQGVATCIEGEIPDEGPDEDAYVPDLSMWSSMSDDGFSYQGRIDYCENLVENGHDDWRLPTIEELRTLIKGCPATVTGGSCDTANYCGAYETCDCYKGCDIDDGPYSYFELPETLGSITKFHTNNPMYVDYQTGAIKISDTYISQPVRCIR